MSKKEPKTEPEKKQVEVIASTPDKNIPKFCTAVNFGVLETKHVVMTLTYNDNPNQPHNLIERVIVDYNHAKQIVEVLSNLIKQVEKGERNE